MAAGLVVVLVAGVAIGYRIWYASAIPAKAPLIGMSTDATIFNRMGITSITYETAIIRAGGRPLAIRAGDKKQSIELFLEKIDGLYLTGGGDVDPSFYGGEDEDTMLVDKARDELELALIEGARKMGMPILGICRGIQVLNVAFDGTLRVIRGGRSKETEKLKDTHYVSLDSFSAHEVSIEPDSLLHEILGMETKKVNSFHGVIVDRVAEDLEVSATAPDGVVEALEAKDGRFIIGVQWHPDLLALEDSDALAVFQAFVKQAAAYHAKHHAGSEH